MPGELTHILALGGCAAAALTAAGHGPVHPIHDEFSLGPLCDVADQAMFWQGRSRYWGEVLGIAATGPVHEKLEADAKLLKTVFGSGAPVEIWASDSLQDLIFAAHCLAWAVPETPVTLRRPTAGSAAPIYGVGAFPPQKLGPNAPSQVLSAADVAAFSRFWQALIAPTPDLLRRFHAAALPRWPQLIRAAEVRLQRLPDPVSGLDSIETRLLEQIRCGTGCNLARSRRSSQRYWRRRIPRM